MIKGVGFHTLWQIAEAKCSFHAVYSLVGSELAKALKSKGARVVQGSNEDWTRTKSAAERAADQLGATFHNSQIQIVFRSDGSYPRALLDLEDPPHWLFVQGNVEILRAPSIAIVGTREPTADGLWLAEYVGLTLSNWEYPTVSGLAMGIDQAIHNASLLAGVPTIAVLGTGITADYPKNAGPLRQKIISAGGAVISEYLPGDSYSAMNFVRRNRLQAALARALIPVEWKERSGTAHTVRYAAGLGRAIAGLRLPTWQTRQVNIPPGPGPRQVFTVPGQDDAFRGFVDKFLRDTAVYRQTSFL
ncbi:DNA-processing protein DprA [Agrobacterium tumefaciens]|nr:DNA-processing protein DprA [Agrobacterium tumefaciens]